jgi:hypothetical protein
MQQGGPIFNWKRLGLTVVTARELGRPLCIRLWSAASHQSALPVLRAAIRCIGLNKSGDAD